MLNDSNCYTLTFLQAGPKRQHQYYRNQQISPLSDRSPRHNSHIAFVDKICRKIKRKIRRKKEIHST